MSLESVTRPPSEAVTKPIAHHLEPGETTPAVQVSNLRPGLTSLALVTQLCKSGQEVLP